MSTPADMSKVNLADGSSASFLIRWKGRQEGPFPADVIGAKLAANEISLLHEICHNGQWVTIRDFLTEKKNSNPNFQIVLATEKQKEKLRFFGCTWDDGITAGQANDALADCAIQFPDAEATWQKNQPAREDQKEKLRYFGCTWNGDINVGQAIDALLQCAIDFPDKEAVWQFHKPIAEIRSFADKSWHVGEEFLPTPEQLAEIRAFGKKPPKGLTFKDATTWIEQCSKQIQAEELARHKKESEKKLRKQERVWDEWATEHEREKTRHEGFFGGDSQPETNAGQIAGKSEVPDWRIAPATEKQKEKLRSFGCAFDAGITAGIAKLLIERHQISQSAEPQITEFKRGQDAPQHAASGKVSNSAPNVFVKEPEPPFYLEYPAEPRRDSYSGLSFGRAHSIWETEFHQTIAENRRRYDRYVAEINQWNALRSVGATKQPEPFPEPPEHRDFSPRTDPPKETAADAPQSKTRSEGFFCGTPGSPTAASDKLPEQKSSPSKWSNLFEERKRAEEVTIQEASKPQTSNQSEYTIPAREVQNYTESSAGPSGKVGKFVTKEPKRPKYISYPREPRRQSFNSGLDFDYDYEKAKTNWIAEVKTIEAENRRRHDIYCDAIKSWYVQHNWNTDWLPLPFPKSPLSQNAERQEVTIQEVVNPRIQKPTAYSYHAPIERFAEWVDGFTERNVTCPGGHWLPAGPLSYVFASDAITIDLCRQMAETIESRGYCVEPDARFGNGTYDRNQTLALFKPLDGDPIQPSTAYLGAANLLRLCILITTADGKIDLVELDVFRRAIENQPGLSLTDHKRLLILEQLLAQELCSASKTAARIAKTVSPDKRLVIGKLLVEVAAANLFTTDGERRVLRKIFKSFEIPPETLEKLITQICPSQWPRPDSDDVLSVDKLHWNLWRTAHPGVVIDDDTLAGKTWNFTDWKALNARWRDLHERLAAQQFNNLPGADSSEGGAKADSGLKSNKVSALDEFLAAGRMLGASGETIQKPVAPPLAKHFSLDMERVYQITNETKEVVAILSVFLADEPEESIKLPAKIALPAPEIPKVSSDSKDGPPPPRFNGLDAVFHPILERLLTRDSWPVGDFDALAREFHFMPGKICETINEWSDEALGEFILDGDDPVVIRRELIAKETIYG